ncbi:MAG: SDR family NAD(P)-dependent oxidoreductase, partial [Planctomycetota bacterium]|nr:SDR family NAD(P)-dependent oxidoreductase [Planctomycetota bacterium]
PEVSCRVLDLAPDLDDPARAIVDEMFRGEPMEVGLARNARFALKLVSGPIADANGSLPLKEGDVVAISGGARGVTAEAALSLAKACRPTLVLLGRSPEPEPEPEWLAPLETESEIKQAILARATKKLTPREIGEEHARIETRREIRRNLERLRETGAPLEYRSVDIRDKKAVAETLQDVRERLGPVRALVHGAGVIADQLILEKSEESFDRVYETKVAGLNNLLAALDKSELRALVMFSSSTARFGRTGQVDYAIANEVLNKIAQKEARHLRDCKVISVNWGPWDGGMVTPSLREVFVDEGIALIPPRQGADHLLAELAAPGESVEMVVLGPNGKRPERAHAAPTLPLLFERVLDVESAPVLRAHVIDGRAVVPVALLVEWLAHGALHGNPGLKFAGFDNLRILKGLVLEPDRGATIRTHAGSARKEAGLFRVPVELHGAAHLHARADVLLANAWSARDATSEPVVSTAYAHGIPEIYETLLFHGPELQGIRSVEGCTAAGIIAQSRTAPPSRAWLDKPLRGRWLADPLVLDVSFQLVVLWGIEHLGCASLPCFVRSYRQFRDYPSDGVRVCVTITESGGTRAVADIEIVDARGGLVGRLEGCECVGDASLAAAFRDNQLPEEIRP